MVAVDFFCGAGGMTQGLRDANVEVVKGVDLDPAHRATYETNHGAGRFEMADIADCAPEAVRRWLREADPDHDNWLLVGCSPCQFWSRVRTDRSRSAAGATLLNHFQRIVEATRPGAVVIENVPGLVTRGNAAVLEPFRASLRNMGYALLHDQIIDCTGLGIPQKRKRFVMVASRVGHTGSLSPSVTQRPTVSQAIRAFPPLAAGDVDPHDRWHRAARLSEENLERLRRTPCDGGTRQAWRDSELQLETYRDRPSDFRDVYGRMRWEAPAPTITTRFNSLSNGRFGHPEQLRAISIREGAALQTFPPEYEFLGSQFAVCRQIGNAVPPLLARRIGSLLASTVSTGVEAGATSSAAE